MEVKDKIGYQQRLVYLLPSGGLVLVGLNLTVWVMYLHILLLFMVIFTEIIDMWFYHYVLPVEGLHVKL